VHIPWINLITETNPGTGAGHGEERRRRDAAPPRSPPPTAFSPAAWVFDVAYRRAGHAGSRWRRISWGIYGIGPLGDREQSRTSITMAFLNAQSRRECSIRSTCARSTAPFSACVRTIRFLLGAMLFSLVLTAGRRVLAGSGRRVSNLETVSLAEFLCVSRARPA
jgi:hypothetical protein